MCRELKSLNCHFKSHTLNFFFYDSSFSSLFSLMTSSNTLFFVCEAITHLERLRTFLINKKKIKLDTSSYSFSTHLLGAACFVWIYVIDRIIVIDGCVEVMIWAKFSEYLWAVTILASSYPFNPSMSECL